MLLTHDFKRGAAAPNLLPVGSLITYEDRANPRQRAVVVGESVGEYGYGQRCLFEDGHASAIRRETLDEYGRSGGAWHFVRDANDAAVVLDAAAIAEFLAMAEASALKEKADAETAARTKETAKSAERVRILEEFPYLEPAARSKKSGHALAASNLRKLLGREFPGVAFSVKSSSFSMGCSVDVSWNDGPTSAEVDAFADRFQDCDFDGSDDSITYRHTVWPEVFGGAKYVHCQRRICSETQIKVAAEMGFVVTCDKNENLTGVPEDEKQLIYREARARSYYKRP